MRSAGESVNCDGEAALKLAHARSSCRTSATSSAASEATMAAKIASECA
eukprot:CAMPEP_0170308376 /NCGR_PEP_ID=MMETSP0116_2-20130129/54628_1 /TAXON_ID=400756 /ORGANISM="Durinskia baltica, Strain CSIRO CS-38" /LENGTH=48 /DNA_ID= /DNA_START= /DNA_END= /DNA_ORIENTATION=